MLKMLALLMLLMLCACQAQVRQLAVPSLPPLPFDTTKPLPPTRMQDLKCLQATGQLCRGTGLSKSSKSTIK